MPPPRLSVVLPVYNEELVLEATLRELLVFLDGLGARCAPFEILCVDDGSTDRSAQMLASAAAGDSRVRVLTQSPNLGKGAAVKRGMLAAAGRFVCFMDADLSTPLAELPKFLDALESGAALVIGNRRSARSKITRHQPWLRMRLGRGFTWLTRTLLAPGIQDFTCGFKAFEAAAARTIFTRSSLAGWAFDAELLVIAQAHGLRIEQLPVEWHHQDDTKVRLLNAVCSSLADMARIRAKRLRGDYR